MRRWRPRQRPVAPAGRVLLGIVTRRDLVRTLARDDEVIATAVRRRLAGYGGDDRWTVRVRDGEVAIRDRLDDPTDRHVAVVLAQSVPGVVAARVVAEQ